ncbi:serine/threonine protein kinase [Polyangium sorediatum]|uniref:Serine/threonine-protein kinase n=1 Tax=Polyangium sorediatum TaxID=889274 RepID=A0ABT6P9Z6_9BACT|nr:serine/threonine-protein kinase [Polyangium sorediatum]MDI1437449.1 serine/threonine-protein kinase [Polyangium sorediatum]
MEGPLRPGDSLLGKYQVERILGQGGMGVVVAVRHLELGELFAIKLLLPKISERPNAVSRFVREARAAARLRSEHVVRVHDVGRLEGGAPYMIMEHLEGDDLAVLLQRRGHLPLEDAATLVIQACDVLAEAHALGIVHRDLKPSNLFLVRRRNGSPCLKVLDFGISKQTEGVPAAEQTDSGAILGSLLYMSPEQMLSPKAVDQRSDIWAMGVVLYELTTGKRPFEGDSLANLLRVVLHNEPPPPTSLQPELPAALDEVVLRCLRKRPEERYANAEELAAAVRGLIGARGEPSLSLSSHAAPSSAYAALPPTLDRFGIATTLPPSERMGASRTNDLATSVAGMPSLVEPVPTAATTDSTSVLSSASRPSISLTGEPAIASVDARPSVGLRRATLIAGVAGLFAIGLASVPLLRSGPPSTPAFVQTASGVVPEDTNAQATTTPAVPPPALPPTFTPTPPTSATSTLPPRPSASTARSHGTSLAKNSESKVEPSPSASAATSAPPPVRKPGVADGVW